MTSTNDFLFYDNSPIGVTIRTFKDFTTFAFETGIIGGVGAIIEDVSLHLAQSLFTHNHRIVATNLTAIQTQIPLKIRGTVSEITQNFNINYVYAPVIHPLVIGISNIAIVDATKGILEVRGAIINTNAIQYTHEHKPLAPSLVIENEEQNQNTLAQLLDVMDNDPNNIALLIPMRDAIHDYEEKAHPIEVPAEPAEEEVKPKRKPRKKKEV